LCVCVHTHTDTHIHPPPHPPTHPPTHPHKLFSRKVTRVFFVLCARVCCACEYSRACMSAAPRYAALMHASCSSLWCPLCICISVCVCRGVKLWGGREGASVMHKCTNVLFVLVRVRTHTHTLIHSLTHARTHALTQVVQKLSKNTEVAKLRTRTKRRGPHNGTHLLQQQDLLQKKGHTHISCNSKGHTMAHISCTSTHN
jgi:hypothetical protein